MREGTVSSSSCRLELVQMRILLRHGADQGTPTVLPMGTRLVLVRINYPSTIPPSARSAPVMQIEVCPEITDGQRACWLLGVLGISALELKFV